ncbi:rCG46770 [Rattus norvegicus]|uniref:RCG46770 n=1 Tax=Rattus norvegicus TaxID=10116 RepID=A6IXD9_RAT|nr:rCG46770 [Rattus norvegicus]
MGVGSKALPPVFSFCSGFICCVQGR